MWLTTGIRGRADRTSNTYAKIDRITGRVYAVTLRNPRTGKDFNDAQITQNNKFGAMSMGVGAWLRAAKAADASAEDKAQLEKFVKLLRAQHQYPNLMSLIVGKRYAVVKDDLTAVTIKDGQYSKTVQFEYNARPLAGQPSDETDFSGDDGSLTPDPDNGSLTPDPSPQGEGSEGNGGNGGSVDPNPVNPDPAAGETYSIQAGVSADGGGSVSIKKNGVAVSGNSVEATGSDTVVIEAVPESGFQFLGWSDGNSQNPRTIQPSADMNVEASFMDLSKI